MASLQSPKPWLKWLCLAVALFGVFPGLIGWGAPVLLHQQLPRQLGEALGRPVSLRAVAFNPWTLELRLEGLQVDSSSSSTATKPLLVVDRAITQLSWRSVLQRAPVAQYLSLQGVKLHVVRDAQGRLSVDDIVARLNYPPARPVAEETAPVRFALHNFALTQAALQLDDLGAGQVHKVDGLSLVLPMLSNLPGDVDQPARPRWAFTLQGAPVVGQADLWPFAPRRDNTLQLEVQGLNLNSFLGYLPTDLPVRLAQGQLSTRLGLAFKPVGPSGAPALKVQGSVSVSDVTLTQADASATLLKVKSVSLALRDVQPFTRQVGLGQLLVDGLELNLHRDAKGQLQLGAQPSRAISPVGKTIRAQQAPAPAWQVQLDDLQIKQGRLNWRDDSQRAAVDLHLHDIDASLQALKWPPDQAGPIRASASLLQGPRSERSGQLQIDGQASLQHANVTAQVAGLNLEAVRPYLSNILVPRVSGQLSAQARLNWTGAGEAAGLVVDEGQISLKNLLIEPTERATRGVPAQIRNLTIGQIKLTTAERKLSLGQVQLEQPSIALQRDESGQLNIQRWIVNNVVKPVDPRPRQGEWQLHLGQLKLIDGRVQWTDEMARDPRAGKPVHLDIQSLGLSAGPVSWPAAPTTAPMATQLSARLASGNTQTATRPAGLIKWTGHLAWAPLQADGQLQLRQLPLHRLMPYVQTAMPVQLARADASFDGAIQVALKPRGPQVQTSGDLRFTEVRLLAGPEPDTAASGGDELLSWQSLALQGLRLHLAPDQRARIDVQTVTLDDFFARLLINEKGRFNLNTEPVHAGGDAPKTAPAPIASETPVEAGAALPLDLSIAATVLRNGRVDFTDHFVQPHYSAQLTELQGQVGRLDSRLKEKAAISLRGRAAGTALLDIHGQVNPLAHPPELDIKAQATELELAPLSPYAIRYAGYGIERGKLTVNLAYQVDPTGQLQASNQIVLNQLTFGDKVDSPTATNLPVRLAVSLLKDRNGVIDINLPVSGSLQDPQFSVGGIVFKLIVNLVGKALSAPFALLSGGDDHDISLVEFEPGTARITTNGKASLERVAAALADRPSLHMTVAGVADPAQERDALARALLEERLRTEQRRVRLHANGASATPAESPAAVAEIPMPPDERAMLLQSVYRQTSLPDKPRNLIGMVRTLPASEAEQRLLAASRVTEDAMRQLALQRGLAVRDALTALGLSSDRLFIAAPKLRAATEAETSWTPRVELSLAAH